MTVPQAVEELAMGDNGWTYGEPDRDETPADEAREEDGGGTTGDPREISEADLKFAIAKLARREDR